MMSYEYVLENHAKLSHHTVDEMFPAKSLKKLIQEKNNVHRNNLETVVKSDQTPATALAGELQACASVETPRVAGVESTAPDSERTMSRVLNEHEIDKNADIETPLQALEQNAPEERDISEMEVPTTELEHIESFGSPASSEPHSELTTSHSNSHSTISLKSADTTTAPLKPEYSQTSIDERYSDLVCTICQDSITQIDSTCNIDVFVRELTCGHIFHDHCIWKWLVKNKAVCPTCNCDYSSHSNTRIFSDYV